MVRESYCRTVKRSYSNTITVINQQSQAVGLLSHTNCKEMEIKAVYLMEKNKE